MPNPDYLPPEYALPAALVCVILYTLLRWRRTR